MDAVRAHARLAPSSSARIVQCPGSVQFIESLNLPPEEDEHTLQGEAAHWVVEYRATLGIWPEVGTKAPNGYTIDGDMIRYGFAYVASVEKNLGQLETRVVPTLHPENWGTPDHFFVNFEKKLIIIDDYKYGFLPVEVFQMSQLVNYYAGIIETIPNYVDLEWKVLFRVFQPRAPHRDGPVRMWLTEASLLRGQINTMAGAFQDATGENPKFKTGKECDFCPARAHCSAWRGMSFALMELSECVRCDPLPAETVGLELIALEDAYNRLGHVVKTRKAEVEALQAAGQVVPGWERVRSTGTLVFKEGVEENLQLLEMVTGLSFHKKPQRLTATQTKTLLISNKQDPNLLKDLTHSPTTYTLVRADRNLANKIFNS